MMKASRDVIEFTDRMVRDCGLDSTSIFFYRDRGGHGTLSYFHHVGVSDDAQQVYAEGRIFESDPFIRARLEKVAEADYGFDRLEDLGLRGLADQVPDYRAYLDRFDVDVVGAATRRLGPGLCLVIGTHCIGDTGNKRNVELEHLERRLDCLSNMVAAQLLGEVLAQKEGMATVDTLLANNGAASPSAHGLSRREHQIARLICQGKLNKEIAWSIGISEYTVENHLRRIYRKLAVHNRANLAAKFAQSLH